MIMTSYLADVNPPIIPVSALHKVNLDLLVEAFEVYFPTPKRDETKDPIVYIIRSFDINKPGTDYKELHGGVLGGSIVQGKLEVGNEIEIRPGYRIKRKIKLNTFRFIQRL
jgi:Translation initiation factor 2, gamma subunit (eIF-2gamma; GTPase)